MIIVLSTQHERRIAIVSDSFALILKSVNDSQSKKPRCAIELVPKNDLANHGFKRLSSHEIYGFVGLIEIDGLIFVGTITGKSKVAQPIPGETVNKIFAVDFFCLNDSRWDFVDIDSSGYPIVSDSDSQDYRETLPRHPCYELRKLLSNGSFYYSSDFDLTSTLQHRGFGDYSLSVDNFQEEYMWNSFLMQEIIMYRDRLDNNAKQILDEQGFLTTVIRGFAETFITYIKKLKVGLTVISKQSWKRAGTRFNARGVDDEGNVANFVETELIMYSPQYCYSFNQIRGSIPVFWEQDTSLINPKVQITRSFEATQPIFDEHFMHLINEYGPVHVVNLLSTKSSEIELSQKYKEHLKKSKKLKLGMDVFLTEFDFHKETAQDGFSAVEKVVPKILDSLLVSGYYSYDVKEKRVISEQQGIFRTNCLDCLDRTNLVQQTISLVAFKTYLEDFHIVNANGCSDQDDFIIKHNNLWADHGDQISQIYTGTNALKSSFSRKGKMSFAGAISDATKSVSRMYINNFMDKGKQQNIDSLLGRLPHQQCVQLYDPINEYVSSKLDENSNEFTSHSTINLLVGTFNVNGTSRTSDLSKWLFPIGDKFKPDFVVLGLQEVIELTAGSILNADYSKSSFWENMVSKCLNQYDEKYILLRVEQMSSLLILFFVKSDKAQYVKKVEGSSKKTGFGGITGNKGAVAIRFEYGSTSFCFVNAHLAAGSGSIDERRNDYENIVKSICFTRSTTIPHHDSIFWLGDLNYRIQLPNEEVRNELSIRNEGYIEKLLKHDQLTQEINSGVIFEDFKEPTLKFRPTYKYDYGTDIYDTSEKARTPSWTDRIVYKGDNLHPLAYSDAPLMISDHKPVYAAYRAKVTYVDEAIKLDLTKRLYNDYKTEHPEELNKSDSFLVEMDLDKQRTSVKCRPYAPDSTATLLDLPNSINSLNDSVSSSSTSLQSMPLQPAPRKETSPATEEYGKAKLRAPPPPAPRSSTTSLRQLERKPTDTGVTTSKKSTVVTSPSRPVPPPIPHARKPVPPGFNEVILTPKNSSTRSLASTPSKAGSPPVLENGNLHSLPVSASSSSMSLSSDAAVVQDTSSQNETDKKVPLKKKVPPSKPAKKPELESLTLESWKPLTPK